MTRDRQKTGFLSADHLELQAESRTSEAALLPSGEARENALANAAQLRSIARTKRTSSPLPSDSMQTKA